MAALSRSAKKGQSGSIGLGDKETSTILPGSTPMLSQQREVAECESEQIVSSTSRCGQLKAQKPVERWTKSGRLLTKVAEAGTLEVGAILLAPTRHFSEHAPVSRTAAIDARRVRARVRTHGNREVEGRCETAAVFAVAAGHLIRELV